MKQQEGKVDRHPNMRLAYVAQHAFHHLEESLDISPVRCGGVRKCGGVWDGVNHLVCTIVWTIV